MSNRCSCLASSTSRICRNKKSFILNDKRYCYIHANKTFNKLALKIQSVYRGNKIRNKLNNIFCKLPDEIQRKIIFHIREFYFLERHHYSVIRNILDKKSKNVQNLSNKLKLSYNPTEIIDNVQLITHIYNLYIKYNLITSLDGISLLKNRVFELKHINFNIYENNYDNSNFSNEDLKKLSLFHNTIMIFQSNYCNTGITYWPYSIIQ